MAKFNVDLLAFNTNQKVSLDVPDNVLSDDINACLSAIFACGNAPGLNHRSIAPGDIIHFENSQYKVMPVGFELVI